MKVKMIWEYKGVTFTRNFHSIAEAYHFYLKQFSTFSEWWYYLRCAHKLLNKVTDERVMESIFQNVFEESVDLVIDNRN